MPRDRDALRQEFEARFERGDRDGALDSLLALVSLDGVTENRLLWKHRLFSELGRHVEALDAALEMERVAERKTPWNLIRVGEAYLALGQTEESLAWLERAIVERGFRHTRTLERAPFDALSDHPQYTELLDATSKNTGVGAQLPEFEVVLLNGKRLRLSDLRGSVALVDFWSTICPPCVAEMPNLKRLHESHAADGFTILGISLDSDVDAAKTFLSEHKIPWPNACSGERWADRTAKLLNVHATPSMWLVDRAGSVRAFDLRGEELEQAVRGLLARA